jgi:hypothetical protein
MRFMMSLVLCFALCGSAGITSAVQVQSDCQTVRGTVEAQIIGSGGGCLATIAGDVFDETGTQIGTTTACIQSLFQEQENGAIHAELTHSYSIGSLNFITQDEGVLTMVGPELFRFENRLTVVGGATGFLRAHGLVHFDTGEIDLTFTGRICRLPV